MISLKLENFQGHKDSSLIIDGFTVLIGKSNGGKSSIRRAIGSVLFNDWDKSFVRSGTESTKISLSDGTNTIIQTKPKNSYEVNGNVYPKIGTAVPDEFAPLGIKKLEADGTKYNLISSSQLDSLFMMTYSDQDNTRILNKIFAVERYELASKEVKKDKESYKSQANLLRDQISNEKGRLTQLKELENLIEKYESKALDSDKIDTYLNTKQKSSELKVVASRMSILIELMVKAIGCQSNTDKIDAFIYKFQKMTQSRNMKFNIEQAEKALIEAKVMQNAVDILTRYTNSVSRLQSAKALNKHIDATLVPLRRLQHSVSNAHSLGLFIKMSEKKVQKLEFSEVLDNLETKLKDYKASKTNATFLCEFLEKKETLTEKKELITKIDERANKLRSALPEICPNCGQPMRGDSC